MTGKSSMRRCDRLALRLGRCTEINQLMAAGRVLCDADAMELHRRWLADGSVACLMAIDAMQAN